MQSTAVICVYSFSVIMFCLSGKGSVLTCDIFPPIELSDEKWELGLIDFMTYHSIPNIEEGINNVLYYGTDKKIVLPTGSYEISDIATFINDYLIQHDENVKIIIKANNNTLKSEIYSNVQIDFSKPDSLATILGFETCIINPNKWYSSTLPISIVRVESIRLICNLISGSYNNGIPDHIIHEFYPSVPPGFKIVEKPTNVIYLPVNTSRIHNIVVRLEDQQGRLINFRNEIITLRLYLRKQ